MGDGSVALIVDVVQLLAVSHRESRQRRVLGDAA